MAGSAHSGAPRTPPHLVHVGVPMPKPISRPGRPTSPGETCGGCRRDGGVPQLVGDIVQPSTHHGVLAVGEDFYGD